MSVQSLHFQLIVVPPPIARLGYILERLHFKLIVLLLPIAQLDTIVVSNWAIGIEFYLDPCAFDYTKFDDWLKLTLPFGVQLNF